MSVSLPKGDLTIGVTKLMEMSFAELKTLNAVGVARPRVGKCFQANPKIKIRSVVPPFCWFLWFRNVELSIKYEIPAHCMRVYRTVALPWLRQSANRRTRKKFKRNTRASTVRPYLVFKAVYSVHLLQCVHLRADVGR